MTQFKIGDRVRLKERYATAEVGTEGTVARTKGDLLYVDTLMAAHAGIFAGRFELIESRKDSPRAGDTVRVVLEGEVRETAEYGFSVTGIYWLAGDMDEVKSVEIIKPAKPSAADLPEGSAVKLTGSAGVAWKLDGAWEVSGLLTCRTDGEIDAEGWTLLVEQASE